MVNTAVAPPKLDNYAGNTVTFVCFTKKWQNSVLMVLSGDFSASERTKICILVDFGFDKNAKRQHSDVVVSSGTSL